MHTNVKKIIKIMEQIAPSNLALSWDNVGLLVGDENKMIENILLTLEVTPKVIEEAVDKNVDLIISHHPLIFKPLKKINTNDPISKMVIDMIQNNIQLYSAHTNLDISKAGTCYYMAELLELDRLKPLTVDHKEHLYKVQTFVPKEHLDSVKTAMTNAGAGQLENYEACTFIGEGIGQFKPLEGANPTIGSVGELESVEEYKLEAIVESSMLSKTLNAMIKAHPYEVPAYDVIKLENTTNEQGIGVVGYTQMQTIEAFAKILKEKINHEQLRVVGDLNKKISSVAIVTGAGSDYIKAASKKADILITGDLKYHEAHLASQLKIAVIDAGHYETEHIYMPRLKEILDEQFEEKSYDVNVMVTETNNNPFQLI